MLCLVQSLLGSQIYGGFHHLSTPPDFVQPNRPRAGIKGEGAVGIAGPQLMPADCPWHPGSQRGRRAAVRRSGGTRQSRRHAHRRRPQSGRHRECGWDREKMAPRAAVTFRAQASTLSIENVGHPRRPPAELGGIRRDRHRPADHGLAHHEQSVCLIVHRVGGEAPANSLATELFRSSLTLAQAALPAVCAVRVPTAAKCA